MMEQSGELRAEQIKRSVEEGHYRVDPWRVADAVLRSDLGRQLERRLPAVFVTLRVGGHAGEAHSGRR
jgi:hypothetical protein